ncbi:hypothetical protein SDC9_198048 [bioreactor metagenome]|uniref:Uncharacterized protein n=1 Tax=bioreactor metagenome TaxID=1076179 RepID=A0A645IHW1_9ZZZZ
MNFADPSGSSPPLKPPGIRMIWLFLILAAISSMDSISPVCVMFLSIWKSTAAPALSKARFESISQFVPGKTGMKTRGFAIFTGGEWIGLIV